MDDKIRSYIDARDCGQLSKSHPLQSALSLASVMPSKKSGDVLEETTVAICKFVPKKHKLSLSATAAREIAAAASQTRPASRAGHGSHASAGPLSSSLALADDLYASNEALSLTMMKAQSEEIERYKASLDREIASRPTFTRNADTVPTRMEVQIDPPPAVAVGNKFRSAKEQFSLEVCSLALEGAIGRLHQS